VVTHHPQLVGGHGHLEVDITRAVARKEVGLDEADSVDVDLAVSSLDGVASDADNAFDEVVLTGRRSQTDEGEHFVNATARPRGREPVPEPTSGVAEDHDVSALDASHVAGLLVHEHPVTDAARATMKGRLH